MALLNDANGRIHAKDRGLPNDGSYASGCDARGTPDGRVEPAAGRRAISHKPLGPRLAVRGGLLPSEAEGTGNYGEYVPTGQLL